VLSSTRRRRLIRTGIVAATGAVLLSACTAQATSPQEEEERSAAESTSDSAASSEPSEPAPTEEPEPEPPCELAADLDPVAARESAAAGSLTAHEAVRIGIDCAEEVVIVPPDDPALAAIAVPVAVASGAPLLIGDRSELTDLLSQLGDPEVREFPPDADEVSATDVAEELGRQRFVAAPEDRPARLAAAARVAVHTDAAVLPIDVDAPAPTLPPGAEVTTIGDLSALFPEAPAVEDSWEVEAAADTGWLVDPVRPAALPTIALAALRGEQVIAVGGDLLGRDTVARVRDAGFDASTLIPVGAFDGDPGQEVVQLAEAPLLPGGSLRLFHGTRMVAVYGHPGSHALGVLGEQDLDATVERARDVGAGYDADGRDVIPTFEIIATIASASAGDDGNYSRVTPVDQLRPWVDRAGEEGFQVILDLQPGRTDFLTQARIYEDLLREPHVGLALDPEWRLEDDQVHLRQIGGVDAAEVQTVVDWLAELTREEGLTHKLLVLHQFRHSMLRDRDTIEVPPEIAAVVHADGQGPQATKLDTWRALTGGAEDRWCWGWKNFYDEDPVVAEPSYVLDLEPDVVLVTFQ
jgi:hypothetical protein